MPRQSNPSLRASTGTNSRSAGKHSNRTPNSGTTTTAPSTRNSSSRNRDGGSSRDRSNSRGGTRTSSRNRDRHSDASLTSESSRTSSSVSVIDPSKPAWWNEQKKQERQLRENERHDRIRSENEQRKISQGNIANYGKSSRGGVREITDVRVGARASGGGGSNGGSTLTSSNGTDRGRKKSGGGSGDDRGGAGAVQYYDGDGFDNDDDVKDDRDAKRQEKMNMDVMDMHDDRINRKQTAEEELQGRSIWDLVDRGTLMVGCCLILIVIIAVTIPVALISEDEPYVAPPVPDAPSFSPTRARDLDKEAIGENIAKITPGGMTTLLDPNTAHYRAWMWLVYEDGMELGPEKDHLHQRFVLMVIYFISGPWTPVEGRLEWGSPVHECEWEGIFCKDVEELEDELEGRIEELLQVGREDGIKIDVPQRIANRLELRQRLVSGEVPAEFSLLYYLQHLDLENNKLIGALPTPLYKLFNLQTLFLEQNELTNVDAIGEYRHLENLALSKNNFQGPLPESFKNLKKLKTLYLHTNGFTGTVFDILKDFEMMELLDIQFNNFEGTLPAEIGNMKNLTNLFVGHNDFHGTIPKELGMCKNLKQFQLDASHDMGGPIPSILGQLSQLEFIKLDTCAYNGTLPMSLGNLEKLTFLDVNSNDLEGRIPSQLGKAISLETLGLANNDFEGDVPSELGKLTNLKKLYLQNTDLSGIMPEEVCALRDRGDETVLEVLWVPCDVECDEMCCTNCS